MSIFRKDESRTVSVLFEVAAWVVVILVWAAVIKIWVQP